MSAPMTRFFARASAFALPFLTVALLAAQGGQGNDAELRRIIQANNLTGDAINSRKLPIPGMDDPMVVLGKALFWTRAMSADREVACVTCHHPFYGFGDNLPITAG